jgi:hypothetical protein
MYNYDLNEYTDQLKAERKKEQPEKSMTEISEEISQQQVEDIEDEEREELEQEFIKIMKEKFINGEDSKFFDYRQVDEDESLDDIKQQQRDAGSVNFTV